MTEYKQKLDQIKEIDPEKIGGKVEFIFAVNKLSEGWDVDKDFCTVDQVVLEIERRFKKRMFERKHFDFGDGIVFDDIPGPDEIEEVIRAAMTRTEIEGDLLSADNKHQIELFFNQFLPKGSKKVIRGTD